MQQIYANLLKITKNASSFVNWFLFGLLYLVELHVSLVHQTSTQNLEILLHVNYCNLCKLIHK